MVRARSGGGGGTVAFLDDGQQGALFDPFAAALRRQGIRTLRISPGRSGLARWLRDKLFYTQVLRLPARGAEAQLPELLARHGVADVQLGEATLARLGLASGPVIALAERALACRMAAPSTMFDKFAVNARLADAGVRTPAQIEATEATAEVAAERLGLPLMVKRRTAEGGRGVQLARSVAAVPDILARWGAHPEEVFFQAYVPGDLVMYAALVGPTGTLVEHGFSAVELQAACGPSARVRLYDDADLAQAGRRVSAVLGVGGLAQFDFIRDAAGQLWHLDANPRCWGSMLSAEASGCNFVRAYVAMIRGAPPPSPAAGHAGRVRRGEFQVQPYSLLLAATAGAPRRLPAAWRAFADYCAAGPGSAYGALLALKVLTAAGARWLALVGGAFRWAPSARPPGWRRPPRSAPPSARR